MAAGSRPPLTSWDLAADESWGGLRNMPSFVEFTATPAPGLRTIFRGASDDALDLLSRMMAFDASRRISAADALQHRYFRVDPLPTPPELLPRPAGQQGAAQPAQPSQPQLQASQLSGAARGDAAAAAGGAGAAAHAPPAPQVGAPWLAYWATLQARPCM